MYSEVKKSQVFAVKSQRFGNLGFWSTSRWFAECRRHTMAIGRQAWQNFNKTWCIMQCWFFYFEILDWKWISRHHRRKKIEYHQNLLQLRINFENSAPWLSYIPRVPFTRLQCANHVQGPWNIGSVIQTDTTLIQNLFWIRLVSDRASGRTGNSQVPRVLVTSSSYSFVLCIL